MWRHVAPLLTARFTVIASDLRGYGDSSAPEDDDAHVTYSRRTLAADQVALMSSLGHERFAVAGHDRGGRVVHRMTLDFPEHVERLAVLDIVPTLHMFENVDGEMAQTYFHWFFLNQPGDLPERLIGLPRGTSLVKSAHGEDKRMSRRHQPNAGQGLLSLVAMLPWWAALALAVISYVLLHHVATQTSIPVPLPGQVGTSVAFSVWKSLAGVAMVSTVNML
jgi:pimeloyl-ACP methyl ester carboxylesterase